MKLSTYLVYAASASGLATAAPHAKRAGSFKWFGASESVAEFGQQNIPGVFNKDYRWPDPQSIKTLASDGMNVFRIPFLMERLFQNGMTGNMDADYLGGLKDTVNAANSAGAYAVLDPHNYGRYNGQIITSTSDFGAFWATIAQEFASNSKVIFDTNNEYHGMDENLVVSLNQAAIDAIRGAGATSQYIFAEGNSWTGAWTWTEVNDAMKALSDPQGKLIYEMHQYLDSDGSGTSPACVSSTIGKERVTDATQWLKDNGKVGFLGEFAGGPNSQCKQAVEGMLSYMQDNSDVWMGASWWAAGPWWQDYMYSMEPPSGTAYTNYLSTLKSFFPGNSSGGSGDNGGGDDGDDGGNTGGDGGDDGSNGGGNSGGAQHWAQCGGKGWSGATSCVSPYTCHKINDWYSQCL